MNLGEMMIVKKPLQLRRGVFKSHALVEPLTDV